jgi:hypothetical protein
VAYVVAWVFMAATHSYAFLFPEDWHNPKFVLGMLTQVFIMACLLIFGLKNRWAFVEDFRRIFLRKKD